MAQFSYLPDINKCFLKKKHEIGVYLRFYLYFCNVQTIVCGLKGTTTLRNKRHCTLCFWWLERRKFKSLSKTIAEVTPTGVYIRNRSVPRANYALTGTLLGASYIYLTWVSNLYVQKRWLPTAKIVERADVDTPFFVCGYTTWLLTFLAFGYQSEQHVAVCVWGSISNEIWLRRKKS